MVFSIHFNNDSPLTNVVMPQENFTLAHLTDPHLTPLTGVQPQSLLNKRILGYLSWQLRRRHEHRPEVLAALIADLHRQEPDHITITGDLTQISLDREFQQAAQWLTRLGAPDQISVVPGNHDTYIPLAWHESLAYWQNYMTSDSATEITFPFFRRRGPVALIGINSAVPSAPFLATGMVGEEQIQRLTALLEATAKQNLFRIILIHHPPHPEAIKARKRLTDSKPVQTLLRQYGCELILHGHTHLWQLHWLPGPNKTNIPMIGVPSASAIGHKRGYRARYHLYRIEKSRKGWQLSVEIRGLGENLTFAKEGSFIVEMPKPIAG
ncbi:MAG: hypothetical protein AXA67_11540 [Methylothermaceae bacteria B42]|nr:MAG: hypothetical protein AXA67_11540 [Methylothermaceae bacteria B42]